MQTSPKNQLPRSRARAFTLVDLMVSIAVIGLLVGLLTPAVAAARNAALRSACAANVRQQGLASQMYAYDREGRVPGSVFGPSASSRSNSSWRYAPSETVNLRIDPSSAYYVGEKGPKGKEIWDGLGLLFKHEYIEAPEVFYCPRETSEHTLARYRPNFGGQAGPIVGNYQLRLADPKKFLSDLDPSMALIANSMRSPAEYSHTSGNNMLLADMSVQWFADGLRLMAYLHPIGGRSDDRASESTIEKAWGFLDQRRVPVNGGSDGDRDMSGDPSVDQVDKTKKANGG